MNPIFHWVITHTVGRAQVRRCPTCRRAQLVPKARQRDEVTCRACGSAIPPPRPAGTMAP